MSTSDTASGIGCGCALIVFVVIIFAFIIGSLSGGGGSGDCYSTGDRGSAQYNRDLGDCIRGNQ